MASEGVFSPDQLNPIQVGAGRPTESVLARELNNQLSAARQTLSDFSARRAPKQSFWDAKKAELFELAGKGITAAVAGYDQFQDKVYKPLQNEGYIPEGTPFADFFSTRSAQSQEPVRAVSALAALVATQDPQKAAGVYRMPQEQIADEAGGLATDYLSQAGYPGIAPAAGTAVNTGINLAGF